VEREELLRRSAPAFLRWGFAKASMAVIADEVGLSRQALYNHFKHKRELLEAAVAQFSRDGVDRFQRVLSDEATPLSERLLAAFDGWWGQYVELLRRSPHAGELLELAASVAHDQHDTGRAAVLAVIASAPGFADRIPPWSSPDDAAFTAYMAIKGLSQISQTRMEFTQGTTRILAALLDT
jgi:AcrR family transcriptional regulator